MNKLTISIVVAFGMAALSLPGQAADVRDMLGTWEGESICTVRPSPCHDEHVIYEISKVKNSDRLTMSADKVVAGERQYMGTLECRYQPGRLLCHYRDDAWNFTIEGQKMTGTLVLSDGRLYRRISVRRR